MTRIPTEGTEDLRAVEARGSCDTAEHSREVKGTPAQIEVHSERIGGVYRVREDTVLTIDLAVTIDVHIADITSLRARAEGRTVLSYEGISFFLRLEEPISLVDVVGVVGVTDGITDSTIVHVLVSTKVEDLILVVGEVTTYAERPVAEVRLVVQCDFDTLVLHRTDISVVGFEGELRGDVNLHQDIGRLTSVEVY